MTHIAGWVEALDEATAGLAEGGVPIGAALLDASGKVISSGHNLRYQLGDVTAHAEMVTLRRAGLLTLADLATTTMVTTSIPCQMCAGTIVHLGIPRVVAGLARVGDMTLPSHRFLLERGVDVVDLGRTEPMELMLQFAQAHPDDWTEDLGTAVTV